MEIVSITVRDATAVVRLDRTSAQVVEIPLSEQRPTFLISAQIGEDTCEVMAEADLQASPADQVSAIIESLGEIRNALRLRAVG